jgi:tetratricopeptide (TPR) repeat protein
MYQHNRKIKRDYSTPFFYRRNNTLRLIFVLVMLLLIAAIPSVAFWQYDYLQHVALDAAGYAPTATPFASDRARLGTDFYRQGDIETAAAYFEMAANQQPENISYLYEYGTLLIELDRNDEATLLGERMIELAPNDVRGYALKASAIAWTDPTVAIPVARQGIEIEGANQFAPLHSALAIAYTRIGRYEEALREGDLAIRIDEMDAGARRSIAYPLIFTGNYSEAIRQLELAVSINPNIPGPYFELASLYRNPAINRPEVALAIYEEILAIEPENERAWLRICETYAAAGLFQEAEPFCDRAIEIDEDYASAHRMNGQLRYSRRNYEGGIEEFQTCLRLYAEQTTGRQYTSEVEIDLANLDFSGLDIECLYIRGLAHYFLGQCEDAWAWLNISMNHPEAQGPILESILIGLGNTTVNCAGYQNRALPTQIPPTPIPPTPIGGY